MSDIYRRQVAPSRATDTLPFAREETFGGDFARAVGRAGEVVGQHNIAERQIETERERDMQASAASLAFVRLQEEAASHAAELQENAEPGGAGFTETVDKYLGERESAFLGTIADEKVRSRFTERFAEWRADTSLRAEGWERGQSVKLTVDNHQQTTNLRANRAARLDADGYAAEIAAHREDVAGLENVPPDIRGKLEREGITEITVGWIGARPPEERIALLDSGVFDQLEPQIVRQLRGEAEVDQRRAAIEAEARGRIEKAEAKDDLDQLLRELGDGVPKSDADLAAAQALADKWGFDKSTYDLGKARVKGTVNREFAGATPVQIDAEVKALDTRIARAGDNAAAADIVRRDALIELRDTREQQIDDDPAAFATSIGKEWPPLDFADSGSIVARRRAADATAEATGRPAQYLTAAEAKQVQANLGSLDGQRAAIDLARGFGGRAGAAVIRQLAPSDSMMLHLTGLTDYYGSAALEGRELVKRKAYAPPKDLDVALRSRLGRSLMLGSAAMQGGVIESARSMYAYFMAQRGDAGAEVDEDMANAVVDRALGNVDGKLGDRGGRGGIAKWNDAPFVLPATMTSADFGRRMASIGKLGGFFWGDGESPVTPDQLRSRFTPVRVGGTRYAWVTANGEFARDKTGGRAVLDIAKVAAPAAAPAARARPTRTRPISPYEFKGR